jgi:hypothetical protein
MNKPDFQTISRAEFKQYILNNREDTEALHIYLDRFTSEDAVIFPAPQSIEDLENFPELHRENLEKLKTQA